MNRKHGFLVITGFLLAFTFGLLVNFPVAKAIELVSLPPQVRLQGVAGSLFHGSVNHLEVDRIALHQLKYRFQPSCLLRLKLCVNLQSDVDELDANVQRSLFSSDFRIVSSRVKVPDGLLDQAPNLLVKPQGVVTLRVESLQLSETGRLLGVQAVVDWQGASIEGEDQVLGDYRTDVSSSPDGVSLRLSANPDNLLGAEGDISLNWQGRYSFNLSLATRSGLNPSLRSVVDSFASKNGLGRYRVKQNGQLPPSVIRVIERLKPLQGSDD